jgi:uncharacterized membrane protein (DUF373 family)
MRKNINFEENVVGKVKAERTSLFFLSLIILAVIDSFYGAIRNFFALFKTGNINGFLAAFLNFFIFFIY